MYSFILLSFIAYILLNIITKKLTNNIVNDSLNVKSTKLYYDKLFIIKLIRIVKENLIFASQFNNIIHELNTYLNLDDIILYKNHALYYNNDGPNFVASENNFSQKSIDLNKYLKNGAAQFLNKVNNNDFFIIKDLEGGENNEYIVFMLKDYAKIIGALVFVKNATYELEASDFDTIRAACNLLEYVLIYDSKALEREK